MVKCCQALDGTVDPCLCAALLIGNGESARPSSGVACRDSTATNAKRAPSSLTTSAFAVLCGTVRKRAGSSGPRGGAFTLRFIVGASGKQDAALGAVPEANRCSRGRSGWWQPCARSAPGGGHGRLGSDCRVPQRRHRSTLGAQRRCRLARRSHGWPRQPPGEEWVSGLTFPSRRSAPSTGRSAPCSGRRCVNCRLNRSAG